MRDDPLIQLIIVIAPLSLLGDRRRVGDLCAAPAADASTSTSGSAGANISNCSRSRASRPAPARCSRRCSAGRWQACSARWWRRSRSMCPARCCASEWRTPGTATAAPSGTLRSSSGLRPIGAGLMIAGGVMILRIESSGWLGWAVAFAVVGVMTWRPAAHPMLLLAIGAAIVAVRARARASPGDVATAASSRRPGPPASPARGHARFRRRTPPAS